MNNTKLTLAEIKAERMAEAKARLATRREEAEIAKYNNPVYVDALVAKEERIANIAKLENLIIGLNDIDTIKVPTLGKISVNCFPIANNIFGAELGNALGIADTLSRLFLEDHIEEAYPLVGSNPVSVEDLQVALGRPAYFNKNTGELTPESKGNFSDAYGRLEDFMKDMGINADMSRFTESKYNKWFKSQDTKAETKHSAYLKSISVDNIHEFTIEDLAVDENIVISDD